MSGVPRAISHGGALDRAIERYGGRREDWLDLSTGINPNPYPIGEIASEAWARLPDSLAETGLLNAARKAYGVPERLEIVAAPGTQALIQTLPRLLPGGTATIFTTPNGSYGEHAHCCAVAGRQVRHTLSPDDVTPDERLVIAVNPNNPDGHVWSREALLGIARELAARGGHLVVDEAFRDVAPAASLIGEAAGNTLILRSFGKFFGLAGLRLGFAICSPERAEQLRAWIGPWAVSGPSLAIGARALNDSEWIEAARSRLEGDSKKLAKLLEMNRFSIVGRNPLFVLAHADDARSIADGLARRRILVRVFDDRPGLFRFGLCADTAGLERLSLALGEVI